MLSVLLPALPQDSITKFLSGADYVQLRVDPSFVSIFFSLNNILDSLQKYIYVYQVRISSRDEKFLACIARCYCNLLVKICPALIQF